VEIGAAYENHQTIVSCRVSLLEAGLRHFRMTADPNCRPGKQTAVKRRNREIGG
jgi:hypothetical protein